MIIAVDDHMYQLTKTNMLAYITFVISKERIQGNHPSSTKELSTRVNILGSTPIFVLTIGGLSYLPNYYLPLIF